MACGSYAVCQNHEDMRCCHTVGQAARCGHLDELKCLISEGHPVDAFDNRGWSPVHEAASVNSVECLHVILSHESASINGQSFDGQTALFIAANSGYYLSMETLLQSGADPNLCDFMGNSPLMAAVNVPSRECAKLLISHNADLNCQNFNQSTALHAAVKGDRSDIVELLLHNNARVDLTEESGISVIFLAAQLGHVICLSLILEHLRQTGQVSLVNHCAEDGASPLFLAAQEGHEDCVKLLLDNDACANLATCDPVALPLHAALQFNHVGCVKLLLPHTDHGMLSRCSASPYYFSMMHSDQQATHCLVDAHCDVNASFEATDDDEYQPKVLRYFNSNIRFGRHFSPLVIIALYDYSLHHADALLAAGADPNCREPCHVPALLPALDMFNLELVFKLINAGANVNVYNRHVVGNMALVVCFHYWTGLQLMLRCGAEPDSLLKTSSQTQFDDDTAPICLWRLLVEARYVMNRRGLTVMQVLYELIRYAGNVTLDTRLAGYLNSHDEWNQLKSVAESPRQLSHLCRRTIRKCFTAKQLLNDDNISALPLPSPVCNYVLFKELD